MPPVAMPATASCRKSARTTCPDWLPTTSLFTELRHDLDHLLLAVHHLDQEADAVDVALRVPRGLDQDARLLLRRDGQAVHQLGERLAVKLAHFLGRVLDRVHRGVALDAVVVGQILEAL